LPVHLAVIDGWEGMEGNGPIGGDAVDTRVAIASTDAVAADVVGVAVMGFDPAEIGYLQYASGAYGFEALGEGDLKNIKIVGGRLEDVKRSFKPHASYERQRKWKIPEDELKDLVKRFTECLK